MKRRTIAMTACGWVAVLAIQAAADRTYIIVDTGQDRCYDGDREQTGPAPGAPFHGQDAHHRGVQPAYRNNGDGTVSDLNTGLMWQQDPGDKMTYGEAVAGARACRLAGHADWRLPGIKELYSLIDFRGVDPRPEMGGDAGGLRPFLDTTFFRFQYGKAAGGERLIDSQFASSTLYVPPAQGLEPRPAPYENLAAAGKMFGVNFADGRIKGYGLQRPGRGEMKFYVRYVRGNPDYGKNHFVDNGNGTVTDTATGLTWQQADSGKGMNWEDALSYAETLELAGEHDWRLPNAKELQSLVDYTRSPDATGSAAIDRMFHVTAIRNEAGQADFPCYWTSTTHVEWNGRGRRAVYVAFGRSMGFMHGHWVDVHGAGAQRSDPKAGDPADYPQGRGPQGDAVRILNHVRCVRGGDAPASTNSPDLAPHDGPVMRGGVIR